MVAPLPAMRVPVIRDRIGATAWSQFEKTRAVFFRSRETCRFDVEPVGASCVRVVRGDRGRFAPPAILLRVEPTPPAGESTIGRWAGVPFFLRTGKRLAEGKRIISIAFREPPKSMFPPGSGVSAQGPDHLTFDLADAAKMSLSFYGKRPGPGMRLDKLSMQFAMHDTGLTGDVLEAYERLILDAMRGDHTLFTTAEGIERLWEVSMPLLEAPRSFIFPKISD